jgi:hypothetical protein
MVDAPAAGAAAGVSDPAASAAKAIATFAVRIRFLVMFAPPQAKKIRLVSIRTDLAEPAQFCQPDPGT